MVWYASSAGLIDCRLESHGGLPTSVLVSVNISTNYDVEVIAMIHVTERIHCIHKVTRIECVI